MYLSDYLGRWIFPQDQDKFVLLISPLLKLQFVPSLLGALTGIVSFLLILVVLTILLGRIYCSTICPVGTMQDFSSRIASFFKTRKSRNFKYSKPFNKTRFSILAIVLLFLITGITTPLLILDPYSNFGRVLNQLIRPAEVIANNTLAQLAPEIMPHLQFTAFAISSFILAVIFLVIVLILSALRGRLYCNTICPVGTFLGIFSKYAIIKPVINKSKCTNCRACEKVCKSVCIDLSEKKIEYSRCVVCFNCADSCKFGALDFKNSISSKKETKRQKEEINSKRRANLSFLVILGVTLASSVFGSSKKSSKTGKAIAPPGALSIDHLKNFCTSCNACMAACPSGIIKPSFIEYGLDGMLLPKLVYDDHFCNYECKLCSDVCPTGALKPLSIENKKLTKIGEVQFDLEKCIVHTDGTDCGACDEHCPTKAIKMVPYKDSLFIPSTDLDVCIGCGACEYICPARPKAMIIKPLEVQERALPPRVEKQDSIKVDDFGF